MYSGSFVWCRLYVYAGVQDSDHRTKLDYVRVVHAVIQNICSGQFVSRRNLHR